MGEVGKIATEILKQLDVLKSWSRNSPQWNKEQLSSPVFEQAHSTQNFIWSRWRTLKSVIRVLCGILDLNSQRPQPWARTCKALCLCRKTVPPVQCMTGWTIEQNAGEKHALASVFWPEMEEGAEVFFNDKVIEPMQPWWMRQVISTSS